MALEMATENDLSGIKRPPEMPEQLRMIVRNSLMDTLEAKSAVSMASLKLSAKILPTFAPPTNSADIWKRQRDRETERQRDRETERRRNRESESPRVRESERMKRNSGSKEERLS